MSHRVRAHVGDTQHLQHGRQVGVAAHTLDPVRHVEHHTGPLALDHPGHEILELLDDVHVAVDHADGVAALLEGRGNPLHRARVIALPVLRAEDVDHARLVSIVYYGDLHERLPHLSFAHLYILL